MKCLIQFSAQIIDCEYRETAGDLDYWLLTLWARDREIKAFQWINKGDCPVHYDIHTMIRVAGKWSNQRNFEIMVSDTDFSSAANDDIFTEDEQMKFDFRKE